METSLLDTISTLSSKLTAIETTGNPLPKVATCSSTCRYCRFYKFQGRGNGYCQRLGVPVHSHWRACPLICPPFAPSWERSENG
ncbi:MAG: hypothetical protein GPI90_04010 [Microcystis aeruginosa K13-05]|uniref:Uncharacterized protein n=1 Tax=Microcystis aeruginosa PCC 9717 TaxID=1160286 RepID=I4FUR5_MICAE|nr:hypothetical protein [Microcystis sp. M090S1]NCR79727.1 hypothetical protein [Microcystis aeruginosa K13-10]NCR83861.1 hypothetical protein [Microcystis aeruginosa K13-05]CCH99390.1 conserved hypothetical protein [Microcystis aeruginosa PCC 9717]